VDNGVSGALRNACRPDVVTKMEKTWWDDAGQAQHGLVIPSTQAGVQAAGGGLRTRGVHHIIHAVGPIWTDYPIHPSTPGRVLPLLTRTVRRVLAAAERIGATAVAMPAISGGIFTHWRPDSDIKQIEQQQARAAVVGAVWTWAHAVYTASSASAGAAAPVQGAPSISRVDLYDNDKGSVRWFVDALDELVRSAASAATKAQEQLD
jgi:O-acetyl-ADP-ribose deacetylase (regulator of RNase III)